MLTKRPQKTALTVPFRRVITVAQIATLLIGGALGGSTAAVAAETKAAPKSLLDGGSWHRADTELYSPVFSPDGSEIALVTKRHIPDGHEAEALTEGRLKKREALVDRDPRFADPVIYVIHLRDRTTERVDYGWDPAFAPNGAAIAYAFQLKPISRFRVLADTLAGNDIRVFDRKTGRSEIVAQPDTGHLSTPEFAPEGDALVFGLGGAVNGSFAGEVGIGRVELRTHTRVDSFPRAQAFSLPRRIERVGFVGKDLFAIVVTPTEAGTYVANSNRTDLVKVQPGPQVVYSWGVVPLSSEVQTGFASASDGSLLVYDKTWRAIGAVRSRAQSGPSSEEDAGVVSPNGEWIARRGGESLELVKLGSDRVARTIRGRSAVESITWAPDSSRLAWIAVGDAEGFRFDELRVVSL